MVRHDSLRIKLIYNLLFGNLGSLETVALEGWIGFVALVGAMSHAAGFGVKYGYTVRMKKRTSKNKSDAGSARLSSDNSRG